MRPRSSRLSALGGRLTPEGTRRATAFEQLTVGRLSWETLVRLNRWLEVLGRIATVVWAGLMATIFLGLDVKEWVADAVNSGRPVKKAVLLAVVVPTLAFFAAHSAIGFARWRLQRELWRRDVQKLEKG